MSDNIDTLSIGLFSEILALDQLLRSRLSKVLPKGMELSHFMVLNHLAHLEAERTPAQLAKSFNVTRGAITNTVTKLEWAGYVHVRPDWDDARRKQVVISPSGLSARDTALARIAPILNGVSASMGESVLKNTLSVLRELRIRLAADV